MHVFTISLLSLLTAASALTWIPPATAQTSPQLINLAVGKVTHDSAVLVVKTNISSNIRVDYGPSSGNYISSASSSGQVRHEVPLAGLSTYSTVYYRVINTDTDAVMVPEKSFHNARLPGQAFSFGVISDTHTTSCELNSPSPVFKSIVNQMTGENLDLTLYGGDIIIAAHNCVFDWGTPDDTLDKVVAKYNTFFAVAMPSTASSAFYPTVGNHEEIDITSGKTGFEQEFTLPENNGADAATYGEEYYSFDNGDTHFIVLCTQIPTQEYKITGNQLAWLQQDLEASQSKPWKVVVMHKPVEELVNSTQKNNQDQVRALFKSLKDMIIPPDNNQDQVRALFKQYGVNFVFQGDKHYYKRVVEDGIQYITSAGGANWTYTHANCPEYSEQGLYDVSSNEVWECNFEHLKVDETPKTMTVNALECNSSIHVSCDGSTLDSFTSTNSTLTITNDPGLPPGGDCPEVGTWDAGTSTCTLKRDVYAGPADGITIAGDNITLDGGGHKLIGNGDLDDRLQGVVIDGRNKVTITNLTVSGFWQGISLKNSSGTGNHIKGNTLSANSYGLSLENSSGNSVERNNFSNNNTSGITTLDASRNTFRSNTFSNNSMGIHLDGSSTNNTIYNNNFAGNTTHLKVETSAAGNIFSLPLPVGGNYWNDWSDWTGWLSLDANGDGVADTPYRFSGGQDGLPWMTADGWIDRTQPRTSDPDPSYKWVIYAHPSSYATRIKHSYNEDYYVNSSNTTISANYKDPGANSSGINFSSVNVYLDGNPLGGCTVTGIAVNCPVTDLSDGIHNIYGNVTDNAGNSLPIIGRIIVDSVAPVIGTITPAGIISTDLTKITVEFTDPGSGVNSEKSSISLEDTPLNGCSYTDTAATCTVSGLQTGTENISATIVDNAGNISTKTGSFTVSRAGRN